MTSNNTQQPNKAMRPGILIGRLFELAVLVVIGNFLAAVFFNCIDSLYRGDYKFQGVFEFSIFQFAVIGAIPIIVISLLIESRLLGWEKSSLKRLIECRTLSCKNDLFYATLYCSNVLAVLGFLFSLGMGYYISQWIRENWGWSLLRDVHPAMGFLAQLIIGPFVFYWVHRVQHTRWFWEFHKVHHAADEMTMLNNFRDHPFTTAIRLVFESLPAAILGIGPLAILSYVILSGIIVVWQHSDYDWNRPWLEKYVLIGAAGHRIHHSLEQRHYNKNLGFVVFWDWLFGTLYEGEKVRPDIGIQDSPLHNKHNPFYEMWTVFMYGIAAFVRESVRCFRRTIALLTVREKRRE